MQMEILKIEKMNKVYILLTFSILMLSCVQNKTPHGAKIEFESKEYNIGKIKRGTIAQCYFVVKNTGDSTLVFNNVIVSCECTSLSNEKIEIPAGKSDSLKFIFDTNGKELGTFESVIRVITNTVPDFHKLKITAQIE